MLILVGSGVYGYYAVAVKAEEFGQHGWMNVRVGIMFSY